MLPFLRKVSLDKKRRELENPDLGITNTRIPGPGVNGGRYHVAEGDEYTNFLDEIYKHVVCKNDLEYLTETQLTSEDRVLVVDIDLRHDAQVVSERQYTVEHIKSLVYTYVEELSKVYIIANETVFSVFVMQKRDINVTKDKTGHEFVKDGIHIIFGVRVATDVQVFLRDRVMKEIMHDKGWNRLSLTNSWEDVFDAGITKGTVGWQLYGCRKPDHQRYELSMIFNVSRDKVSGEIDTPFHILNNHLEYVNASTIRNLSVRTKEQHIVLELQSSSEFLLHRMGKGRPSSSGGGGISSSSSSSSSSSCSSAATDALPPQPFDTRFLDDLVSNISSREDLEAAMVYFKESMPSDKQAFVEIIEYVMALSSEFFEEYAKWIRVGWALSNISSEVMFLVWVYFSAQSTTKFSFADIRGELRSRWRGFLRDRNPMGLTEKSIMHWCRGCNIEKYEEIKSRSISNLIEKTINAVAMETVQNEKSGDYDIARVLHRMFKDSHVCTGIKTQTWYHYRNHRWHLNDSGTTLRKAISDELRMEYYAYLKSVNTKLASVEVDSREMIALKKRREKTENIIFRLSRTKDKQNIMTEAKELFYDNEFLVKMDTNPYLVCFSNGVYEFVPSRGGVEEGCCATTTDAGDGAKAGGVGGGGGFFREGHPEDYLSKCTNLNYIPYADICKPDTPAHATKTEVETFMHQLFPDESLNRYMWEHLASTMMGKNTEQTFNVYIGIGQNGKSVLVLLMEKVLGDYKGDVPLSLITKERNKVGAATPEIAALRGIRYAVMQEPSKGDKINEGQLKALTGGDVLQGRALYTEIVTFKPQFKLVVCTNELMEVKSTDHGTWRRFRVVDFKSLFTERPDKNNADIPHQFLLDKQIHEKFERWAPVFASMLTELASKTRGNVSTPDIVMQASTSYRREQDFIEAFIQERVEKICANSNNKSNNHHHVTKKELHDLFTEWYRQNQNQTNKIPVTDLNTAMDKKFGKNIGNVWRGIRLKFDLEIAAAVGTLSTPETKEHENQNQSEASNENI